MLVAANVRENARKNKVSEETRDSWVSFWLWLAICFSVRTGFVLCSSPCLWFSFYVAHAPRSVICYHSQRTIPGTCHNIRQRCSAVDE